MDKLATDLREEPAHLSWSCVRRQMMQLASQLDGFELDGFPPCQDGLSPTEVDRGRGQVVETLVVAAQVVVSDELGEALFEPTRQVVVLEQALVLHGAVAALNLALGRRVTMALPLGSIPFVS